MSTAQKATSNHVSAQELREQTHVVAQDIQALGRLAKSAAIEKYEQGVNKAKQLEKSFEEEVRKHPVRSVLIAAGVGLVVGLVIGRRR
jgi:ElaB/YqjD/DUF883 family membrane-anchored ribosome-binding protein